MIPNKKLKFLPQENFGPSRLPLESRTDYPSLPSLFTQHSQVSHNHLTLPLSQSRPIERHIFPHLLSPSSSEVRAPLQIADEPLEGNPHRTTQFSSPRQILLPITAPHQPPFPITCSDSFFDTENEPFFSLLSKCSPSKWSPCDNILSQLKSHPVHTKELYTLLDKMQDAVNSKSVGQDKHLTGDLAETLSSSMRWTQNILLQPMTLMVDESTKEENGVAGQRDGDRDREQMKSKGRSQSVYLPPSRRKAIEGNGNSEEGQQREEEITVKSENLTSENIGKAAEPINILSSPPSTTSSSELGGGGAMASMWANAPPKQSDKRRPSNTNRDSSMQDRNSSTSYELRSNRGISPTPSRSPNPLRTSPFPAGPALTDTTIFQTKPPISNDTSSSPNLTVSRQHKPNDESPIFPPPNQLYINTSVPHQSGYFDNAPLPNKVNARETTRPAPSLTRINTGVSTTPVSETPSSNNSGTRGEPRSQNGDDHRRTRTSFSMNNQTPNSFSTIAEQSSSNTLVTTDSRTAYTFPDWVDSGKHTLYPHILPFIQSYVVKNSIPHHLPLPYHVTLFFSDTSSTKTKFTSHASYETTYRAIFAAETLPQFMGPYLAAKSRIGLRPTLMASNQNLFLMRTGVKPEWEDPVNKRGGRITITPSRNLLDEIWEACVYAFIGGMFRVENLGEPIPATPATPYPQGDLWDAAPPTPGGPPVDGGEDGVVVGVVMSRRQRGDRVEVWCDSRGGEWSGSVKKRLVAELPPDLPKDSVIQSKYKKHFEK